MTVDTKKLASIVINGEHIFLGYHSDAISAALARITFEEQCPLWKCNHRNINRVKLREIGFNV